MRGNHEAGEHIQVAASVNVYFFYITNDGLFGIPTLFPFCTFLFCFILYPRVPSLPRLHAHLVSLRLLLFTLFLLDLAFIISSLSF